MISKGIKDICKDFQDIENYAQAIEDTTQVWHCHHRLETRYPTGELRQPSDIITSKELREQHLYYGRPSEELIFLTKDEHLKEHSLSCKQFHRGKRILKTKSSTIFGENKITKDELKKKIGKKWKYNLKDLTDLVELHKEYLDEKYLIPIPISCTCKKTIKAFGSRGNRIIKRAIRSGLIVCCDPYSSYSQRLCRLYYINEYVYNLILQLKKEIENI